MSELDILKKQKLREYKERKRELDRSFGKMIVDFFSTSETKRNEKLEKHRDAYMEAFALPEYKNRVERDAAAAAEAAAGAAARRAAQDVVTPSE